MSLLVAAAFATHARAAEPRIPQPALGGSALIGPASTSDATKGLAPGAVPAWAADEAVHFLPPLPSGEPAKPLNPGAAGLAAHPDLGEVCTPEYCPTPPLDYHGGPVQHEPHVYLIFWGRSWNEGGMPEVREEIIHLYQGIAGSSWDSIMSQYFDQTGSVGTSDSVNAWLDESIAAPVGVNDQQVREEVEYALTQQPWPGLGVNNQYVVLAAPGSHYASSFGVENFCGYHGWQSQIGGATYTFLPWLGDEPFFAECRFYSAEGRPHQAEQAVASHEFAESATDPKINAWLTSDGYEISDICSTAPSDQLSFGWVMGLWDNWQGSCSLSDPSPPQFYATASGASNLVAGTGSLNGTVDPGGHSAEFLFEWGATQNYGFSTGRSGIGYGTSPVPVGLNISGLRGSTTYHYRTVAIDSRGYEVWSQDQAFTTPAWPPIVVSEAASGVKAHMATLHGRVNPQGFDTHYRFEYGPTTSYGTSVPVPAEDIGAGTTSVPVTASITGLAVATTYHYRLVAYSGEGTSNGGDLEFKTPNKPVVTAEAPSYVNTLEPQMNATINPERADTHYQFEYGTTEAYGTKVPIPAGDIGSGAPATVEKGLKGLARSTTFHYRVTAENEVGIVHGADKSFTTLPPCKGAEAKCVWSLQEPSNPLPPSKFEMKGVSCASAGLCVAVGKNLYNNRSFVDRWNGSAWSLLSGAVPGEMKHITCLGTGCFAVGVSGGAATTWAVSEYPTGGGTWIVAPITTPLPSGASETVLDGVSCSGETACTAVGSYRGSEGTYHPLVERWNGSAWSLQSAPNPAEGTAQNAMLGVSCISIGCITVGEAAGKPVAETWVSGSWALSSPKLPAGAKGGKLSSVSCTSTSCIAVGDSNEGVGTEKALAESFELLRWELMAAPNPAGAKGFVELAGVSCPSTSACTATGWYAPAVSGSQPTELKTLAETWNGSSWTIQASANSGQRYNVLTDVSCSAAGACTAVGQDSEGFYAEPESLAERWNGSAWSTQKIVNPEEPLEDEMKAVSCSTNTLCVGAGKNVFASNGFAEVWNGTEWMVVASVAGEPRKVSCISEGCFMVGTSGGSAKIWIVIRLNGVWGIQAMTAPLPAGSSESVLDGVSCGTETACTAVGSYKGSEGTYHPLIERWNGTAWALQSAPNPTEGTAQNAMLGVSCAGASSCVAVGEAAGKPVAEVWNGSAWSVSSAPPLPAGAKGATLAGVSCGSTRVRVCMAVGDSYEGAGTEKALAERWNGSAWSIVAVPTPAGAKGFVDLTDIACLSPNACFSSGYYAPELSGGAPVSLRTLVESWEGTEWTILTTPNLTSQTYNALAGISCSTSIDCTAVGGATSNLSKRPPVQLAMRFE